MNMKLNKEILKDQILACWIGKNIGGTMGAPYEASHQIQNIEGFATPKGEPLPNDDLDLQLVWLNAMERSVPKLFDANLLAQTWLTMITPHWNEYSICKKNMRMGLLPPLCGEYDNAHWRHSNGAWIRSEVWACLAPGFPNIAIQYAIMDAVIDHGFGEGTYGEIFTAALESLAFFEKNVRKLIETALDYIPKSCLVSKCVRYVIEQYEQKTPYLDTRNGLVEMTKEIGWLQAPANIGFVVIGLLYGEGDYKKSMIYAINCGDDTDCTGGTVGAILGILGGTAAIPEDWREYIGDRIVQICANGHYAWRLPKSCTELTERVIKMIPAVLAVHDVHAEIGDFATEYDGQKALNVLKGYADEYFRDRTGFSFDITDHAQLSATVDYKKEPVVSACEPFAFSVKFTQVVHSEAIHGYIDIKLPDGWTAEYKRNLHIVRKWDLFHDGRDGEYNTLKITVTPNEKVDAINRIYITVVCDGYVLPFVIPIVLLG